MLGKNPSYEMRLGALSTFYCVTIQLDLEK